MLENLIQDKIDEERRIRALPDGARRVAATAEKGIIFFSCACKKTLLHSMWVPSVAQAAGRFAVPFVHAALESLNNFTNLSVKPVYRDYLRTHHHPTTFVRFPSQLYNLYLNYLCC